MWAILEDREGSFWIGMNGGGLAQLQEPRVRMYGAKEGLASDVALAVHEDRQGALWVSTAGRGVSRLREGRFRTFTTRDGLPRDLVTAIGQDSTGRLWFGAPDGPLAVFDGRQFAQFGGSMPEAPQHVNAIHVTRTGAIWLGHNGGGLRRLLPAPARLYTEQDGLPSTFVEAVAEDREGGLWIATRQGLSYHHTGRFRNLGTADGLPAPHVTAVSLDADGTLWLGTPDAGIARIRDGRVSVITARHGLGSDGVHAIVDDGLGYLWFSSDRGIYRVARRELDAVADGRVTRVTSLVLSYSDGLRSREANGGVQPAGIRRRDGTIWFPTMRGVVEIDPRDFARPSDAPAPIIERVASGGRTFGATDSVVLPLGARTIELAFTALNFRSPEQIRFRYRLTGVDTGWVEGAGQRTARYTNLTPGRYHFEVAANAEGAWSREVAGVTLVLPAHLYETAPLRGAGGLFLLTFGAWMLRRHTRRLRRRNAELRALVDERTQAEQRYRDLFENATDAVFTTGPDGRFTAVNRRMEEITGYSGAELLGRSVLTLLPPDVATPVGGAGGLLHSAPELRPVTVTGRDGQPKRLEVTVREMLAEGSRLGWQGIARDVTERLALEERLQQSQKMEAVGQLAGGVAHDFNNLLTAVISYSDFILAELPGDDPHRGDLAEIKRAGERGAALTQQLLAFSRRQMLQPRVVEVNALIRNLEHMLGRLIRDDIRLTSRLPEHVGRVKVDPGQLEQVIVNLVVNARDALPRGGKIHLETANVDLDYAYAQAHPPTLPGSYVMIVVSDTGVGMDELTKRRLFEPFFTTKGTGKGTGLGLATVYGIVKQSGGYIWVYSELGCGTAFKIYLPRVDEAPGLAEPAFGVERDLRGAETVLLVDDDVAVRKAARTVLARSGYTVLEAGSGLGALQISEQYNGPIHLLLTDVVMPELGGRELMERMKAARPRTACLLTSGYPGDAIDRDGLLEGGAGFLEKPFAARALLGAVREVLEKASSCGPATARARD